MNSCPILLLHLLMHSGSPALIINQRDSFKKLLVNKLCTKGVGTGLMSMFLHS